MDCGKSLDELIHEARMLSFQGKHKEAIDIYQYAVNHVADKMVNANGEEREIMQNQINMYLEEADCIKGLISSTTEADPREESSSVPPSFSTTQRIPLQTPPSDLLSDIGRMFMGIGREVRNFDRKYKITETAVNTAKEVTSKTAEVISNPEWEQRANAMNESIRRWNEENHVSEKISAAFESVAQVTQHVFDSIFPSVSVTEERGGPVSDELYATLPIASPVNATSEVVVNDLSVGDRTNLVASSPCVPQSSGADIPLQPSSSTPLQTTNASAHPSSNASAHVSSPFQPTTTEPIHPMYEQHDPSRTSEVD